MRPSLETLCRLFIENRDTVKATFAWESSYMHPICAAMITDQGMHADKEQLTGCRDLLKEHTGIFSNFRSTAMLSMIGMMVTDSNPSYKLTSALEVYSKLKEHFWNNQYLPLASMIVASLASPAQYGEIVARTRNMYDLMKGEHPFLTSGEDTIYAALFALKQEADAVLVDEMETCYKILKEHFFSRNAVQSLSHVLALCNGNATDKCQKTLDLYNALKERGIRYGTDFELATLGVLAMLPVPSEQVLDDLIEVDRYLSEQKGYGFFGFTKKQRLMHAGMLVTSDYVKGSHLMQDTASVSAITVALVVAQQAAMCAAIAAANAANSAN